MLSVGRPLGAAAPVPRDSRGRAQVHAHANARARANTEARTQARTLDSAAARRAFTAALGWALAALAVRGAKAAQAARRG